VDGRLYTDTGKYQTSTSLEEIMVRHEWRRGAARARAVPTGAQARWSPSEMLPKMYLDKDIARGEQEHAKAK
jgi:hypothetical protein